MSVLGALSHKDKGGDLVLPNLQLPPESTGFFQNVHAGFTQAVAGPHSTRNARAIYESRNYDQIIQALNAEGEKATDYVDSPVLKTSPFYRPVEGEQDLPDGRVRIPVKRGFTNPFSEGPSLTRDVNPLGNFYLGGDAAEIKNIWDAVGRIRARKPGFLKDFPDASALDAIALRQRQADEATAGAVTSRATTLGKVGSFIGAVGGSLSSLDPENLVGGFSGAAGKSFARTVVNRAVSGATANTIAGTVALPGQMADAQSLGQPMTTGDMARSVAENAAAGALLGTAHAIVPAIPHAVGTVAGKVFDTVAPHIPDAIRDPVVAASIRAGTVKDRQLLYEFQRQHSPWSVSDTSTPAEKAAAHVITTDVETQEQSPLQPEASGANNQRLGAVAKALGVDLTPPDLPTTAPTQTATVRDQVNGGRKPASYAEGLSAAEGTTKNPESSADGYFQFTKGTWREYAPRVTDTAGMTDAQVLALRHDKGIASRAEQLFRADNASYLRSHGTEDSPGNLSLAHFLGKADAVKVLKADPTAPIESVIDPRSFASNRKLLAGKSADQVIAWAHKRIGAAVDHPPARPDAVPDEGFDYSSPVRYSVENLKPDELPPTSAPAPTDEPFNHLLSQHLLVWENDAGERSIIDGGKRLAHARAQEDQNVTLPTVVLREKDGISEEMAMLVGKLKNVNLGTTSLEKAAGTLADIPEIAGALKSPQFRQEIAAIAQLPYEDFGKVVSGAVDPQVAADHAIAAASRANPLMHEGSGPTPQEIARRDGRGPYGSIRVHSDGLPDATEPYGQGYRDRVNGMPDANPFSKRGSPDQHSGWEKGWLAAKTNKDKPAPGALEFAQADLAARKGLANEAANARRTAASRLAGEPSGGAGRDLAAETPHENLLGRRQPSLFDAAVAKRDGAEKFSEPAGPEAKEQTALLEHDLRHDAGMPMQDAAKAEGQSGGTKPEKSAENASGAAVEHLFDLPETGFRLSEEGGTVSIKEALDKADADEAAAKALRDCL